LGVCTLKDYTIFKEVYKGSKTWYDASKIYEFVGIIKKLVNFVYFLAKNDIFHSDFKPENITLK
jgi:hypothetical protein